MNITQFISKHGITSSSVPTLENPSMNSNTPMNHFRVTLERRGTSEKFTLYFSMGTGLEGDPDTESVIDCLSSDSSSIENANSFEDFADELGYDPDSRRAEAIYHSCKAQATQFKAFLEPDLYEMLLWKVDKD